MARRRGRGGYRNNPYNRKAYEFTSRRRAALKRAQAISARKKKMNQVKVGIMAAGGLAAVGVGLYLGRNTSVGKSVRRDVAKQVRSFSPQHVGRAANIARARAAVHPINKETMRMAGAISPADAPRAMAHGPLHIGPSTPADGLRQAKPDPATFTRTNLGRQSDASVKAQRDALAAEEAWKKSDAGSLARFTDSSEVGIPHELIAGEKIQPLRRSTAAKAVGQNEAAKARSGVPTQSKEGRRNTVDAMIAGSIDAARAAHGVQTPIRTNPRATGPMHIGAGATSAEHDAIWAEIDRNRGLSTTRPGTVPHVTAHSAAQVSTPGISVSGPVFAVGQGVPGWHKLSKEGKAKLRAIGEPHGFKISAAGKVSNPSAKLPPVNPSGQSPAKQGAQTRKKNANAGRAQHGIYTMPNANPAHGEQVPGWDLLTPQQQHLTQEKFLQRSRQRGWRTMLGASGSYFRIDN